MGLRGDRPLGANAAARRKQRNRQKDQEKRMYSVVESQRAVLQVLTSTHEVGTKGNA